jgi:hypothetical protein
MRAYLGRVSRQWDRSGAPTPQDIRRRKLICLRRSDSHFAAMDRRFFHAGPKNALLRNHLHLRVFHPLRHARQALAVKQISRLFI